MDSGKKMTADQGRTKFAMLEGAPRDTTGSTVQDRRSKVQNVLPYHWMIETGYTPWHVNHSRYKLFPILVGAVDSKLTIWLSTSEACACYASAHQQIMGPTIFWKVLTDQLPQPWLSLCPAVVPHFSVESCARLRGGGQSFGSSAVQRKPALQWHNHSQTQISLSLLSLLQEWKTKQVHCTFASPPSGFTHCWARSSNASALCFVEWSVHSPYRLKV